MNIDELIVDCNSRASKLYLYRQALQKKSQELQQEIMKTEIEMVKTDGELEAYKKLSPGSET
jgi:hypothetical protein